MMFLRCLTEKPKRQGKAGGSLYNFVKGDFDEEEFVVGIHPALESGSMDEVAARYTQLTGNDFQCWLYEFMNDSNRRYTVYIFEEVLFDWITRTYLLASQPNVRASTSTDAIANKALLRSLLKRRVEWPLPYQGIMSVSPSASGSRQETAIPINLVYCTLDRTDAIDQAPWLEHPVAVRVSLVLSGVLYYGVVWDGSRQMEVAGVSI